MGLRRIFNEWREKVDGTLTGPAIETGSIIDSQDGAAWETLRGMGYEKGDFLTLATLTPPAQRTASTASTTFQSEFGLGDYIIPPNAISKQSLQVRLIVRFEQVGAGETPTGRIRDVFNSNTIVTVTGQESTDGNFDSGFVEYNPSSGSSFSRFVYEHQTDVGSNSIQSTAPTFLIGVII
jgi:hypothetical protein